MSPPDAAPPERPPEVPPEASASAPAQFLGAHGRTWLSRIEDAGLNASAPPQQRWMDGWLVRTCPGKAQRARCINAVAAGRRPVAEKLAECAALYRELGLPMLVRITPFTEPAGLDTVLAAGGFAHHDATCVMVLPRLGAPTGVREPPPLAARWVPLIATDYAEAVGQIRGSSPQARAAHAERLQTSPVAYRGYALLGEGGTVLACGQVASEGPLVGLYDVATAPQHQGNGLATWLCKRLLTLAADESQCTSAYLQVGADNHTARRLYARLGFEDGYSYHYRLAAESAGPAA